MFDELCFVDDFKIFLSLLIVRSVDPLVYNGGTLAVNILGCVLLNYCTITPERYAGLVRHHNLNQNPFVWLYFL